MDEDENREQITRGKRKKVRERMFASNIKSLIQMVVVSWMRVNSVVNARRVFDAQ